MGLISSHFGGFISPTDKAVESDQPVRVSIAKKLYYGLWGLWQAVDGRSERLIHNHGYGPAEVGGRLSVVPADNLERNDQWGKHRAGHISGGFGVAGDDSEGATWGDPVVDMVIYDSVVYAFFTIPILAPNGCNEVYIDLVADATSSSIYAKAAGRSEVLTLPPVWSFHGLSSDEYPSDPDPSDFPDITPYTEDSTGYVELEDDSSADNTTITLTVGVRPLAVQRIRVVLAAYHVGFASPERIRVWQVNVSEKFNAGA